MLNKIIMIFMLFVSFPVVHAENLLQEEPLTTDDSLITDESAKSINNFDLQNTVFEQITNLEQDKLLMQLKKEKAQIELDLSRLEAEKLRLNKEVDELKNKSSDKEIELMDENEKLKQDISSLELENQNLVNTINQNQTTAYIGENNIQNSISQKYRLSDITGMNNELEATIIENETGQKRKISVGKIIDGYTVYSISLAEGIVFKKGDITETLNMVKD